MKIKFLFCFSIVSFLINGQQLPNFSQYMSSGLIYNPAIAGTKKTYDLRASYRNQWVGFEGSPETEYLSANFRLLKGLLGFGFVTLRDVTGPSSRTSLSGNLAAHVRFPDVEMSFGLSASLMQYSLIGPSTTIENQSDPTFDITKAQTRYVPDFGAGFYLYNDRFHVGLSAKGLEGGAIKFYTTDTTSFKNSYIVPHLYFSFGYNFSADPDYVWENTFFISSVVSSPISLAYSLRLFYKNQFLVGSSFRAGDAIALHLGYIISGSTQICYSYDFLTSGARKSTNGSHEILVAYSLGKGKKNVVGNNSFQRQKYRNMF